MNQPPAPFGSVLPSAHPTYNGLPQTPTSTSTARVPVPAAVPYLLTVPERLVGAMARPVPGAPRRANLRTTMIGLASASSGSR